MPDNANDNSSDVLKKLKDAAMPGSGTPDHLVKLLLEAAEVISVLRVLVGIRDEIEDEDT